MIDYRNRFAIAAPRSCTRSWRLRSYALRPTPRLNACPTVDLNFVRRPKANIFRCRVPRKLPPGSLTPIDRERIRQSRTPVRRPARTVRARLELLIAATRADELMVTTMVYDHGARRRSYELTAQLYGSP